jgi:hypothetical protein
LWGYGKWARAFRLRGFKPNEEDNFSFPNEEIFHISLPLYDATLKGILASSSSCFSKNIETFGILEF